MDTCGGEGGVSGARAGCWHNTEETAAADLRGQGRRLGEVAQVAQGKGELYRRLHFDLQQQQQQQREQQQSSSLGRWPLPRARPSAYLGALLVLVGDVVLARNVACANVTLH